MRIEPNGHSDKNWISKLVSAVTGAIAAAVGFLFGFFFYKKFFTAKPDQAEFVTPISTDQANMESVRSNDLHKLQEENENLRHQIKELEAELEFFISEHEVTVIELPRQSQEAPISKEEIDKLRNDLIEKDQELKQLRAKEAEKNVDITSLQKERDWLKGQIASKDKRVEGLNREKNDAEWKLREYRQWLSDANNRANGLESACIEKNAIINKLRREIGEMDTQTLDTTQETLPEEDVKPNRALSPPREEASQEVKKRRKRLTKAQRAALDALFETNPKPNPNSLAHKAEELELDFNVVRTWFYNRRKKSKQTAEALQACH